MKNTVKESDYKKDLAEIKKLLKEILEAIPKLNGGF